jgi:hypothetical protein
MRKIMFAPIALLFGCFNPDLTAASLNCDTSHFCPDGYSCIAGLCKLGTTGNNGDMAGGGGNPDLTPNMSGCADGAGSDVSSGSGKPAYACPGTYSAGSDPTKNAARLCAVGWDICTIADTINQNTCNNLGGFFLANVAVHSQGGSNFCGAVGGGGQMAAWAGCGKSIYSVSQITACSGFGKAMFDLSGNNLSINQPYQPLTTTTSNQANTNGVLCCKK